MLDIKQVNEHQSQIRRDQDKSKRIWTISEMTQCNRVVKQTKCNIEASMNINQQYGTIYKNRKM